MIRSLHLANFKAFGDRQFVPLRPITLVFGPNSAGKSSLLHALALAHHAQTTGDLDVHRTTIGGESIDLGGFHQYVHRRDAGRRVEWTLELETAGLDPALAGRFGDAATVAVQLFAGMNQAHSVEIDAVTILVAGQVFLTMSRREGARLRIDRLNGEHPLVLRFLDAIIESNTYYQEVRPEDREVVQAVLDELLPEIDAVRDNFLPRILPGALAVGGPPDPTAGLAPGGDRRESVRRTVQMMAPRWLRDIVNGLTDAVRMELAQLAYLGPLRSYPPRHVALAPTMDPNWHAGGGSAWDVLRKDAEVRAKVNAWLSDPKRLSTPYELMVRDLVVQDQLDSPFLESLDEIDAKGLELAPGEGFVDGEAQVEQVRAAIKDPDAEAGRFLERVRRADIDRLTEMVLFDHRTSTVVSHRDVGIGISQVLPVLVNAHAMKGRCIAIEQPEIHLHPALQAELGDVFIESALGEARNTFLLETHSEHLVLRILRRIRETGEGTVPAGMPAIRPEDVSVLYVSTPRKGASEVVELPVTPDGDFTRDWPDGFFPERTQELF